MAFVGFQYEPVSLDVKKVCLKKGKTSLIRVKNQESQCFTEQCRCGNWSVIHTNVEYLSWGEVEALGYFQLSDIRHDDRNVIMERVSTTVLQLYLIWTPT